MKPYKLAQLERKARIQAGLEEPRGNPPAVATAVKCNGCGAEMRPPAGAALPGRMAVCSLCSAGANPKRVLANATAQV